MATANLPNGMVLRGDQTDPLSQLQADTNWLALRGGGLIYMPGNTDLTALRTTGQYYWSNGAPTGNGFPANLPEFGVVLIYTAPAGPGGQGTDITYQRIEAYSLQYGSPIATYVRRIVGTTVTGWNVSQLIIDSPTKAPTTNIGPVRVVTSSIDFMMTWNSTLGRYVKVWDGREIKEFTINSSEAGSWAGPSHIYTFFLDILIGGGGGGGGGPDTGTNAGAGAGGGASGGRNDGVTFTWDFNSGPLTYTIGAAGAGGAVGGPGTAGGNSQIRFYTAVGGNPGYHGGSANPNGGPGGGTTGGNGSTTHGGYGGLGVKYPVLARGGYMGASTTQAGANSPATNYGGGGGGASGKPAGSSTGLAGGNGTAGFIRLLY